ncbi:MAG: hypothetical protein ACYDCO_25645 [Armatimonadota bacterium]
MTTGTRKTMPRDVMWMAAAAVLLIAGGLGWFLRARPHSVPPASPMPVVPSDIQIRLGKVKLQGISGGKLVWEVEADNFDYAKNRPTLTVSGLKKVSVLNGGKVELTLTASTLEQNIMTGKITVAGDVNVTGKSLEMQTATAVWDPRRDTLQFPGKLTVRFGDYTLTCRGATIFDVMNGQLESTGGVVVTTQGSTLSASAIRVNVADQSFEMDGPMAAELSIADMQTWMEGRQLPKIAPIPDGIKERYREYCEKKERTPVRTFPGRVRPKGVRP